MSKYPVTFTHGGKEYTGDLSQVQGAGTTAVYHLTVDNYYKGRLRLSAFDDKWVFDGEFTELAEPLGAWLGFIDWCKEEMKTNAAAFVYNLIENRHAEMDTIDDVLSQNALQ